MEERRESKDLEILELKEQMKKLDSSMRIYKAEFMYYVLEYGNPLIGGKDRERLEALMKKIESDA